jgi:predicted DNA-binding protein (UPF0251 family)
MPRPRKRRRIQGEPPTVLYKPQGVPAASLTGVTIPLEGFEAMRLVDAESLSQEEAAERMDVSRPTLSRILAAARGAVARAMSEGMAIRIEGGDYEIAPGPIPCRGGRQRCGLGPGAGRGQGRGGGMGRGKGRRGAGTRQTKEE